jgi:glycosyltransferase involved in cell wall biosynthesis
MNQPQLTVLMPVYNGGPFLRSAIESILNQDFSDFDFLIIDDGSTDGSHEIAASYADPRIRLESNGRNLGLIATLNRGLDLARGTYVARMDADDIAFPDRLSKQLTFMEAHPEIGLCGTWYERDSMDGTSIMTPPEDDASIRFFLIFDTVFAHNTIMFRRKFLEDHGLRYDPDFRHAEDFEFWTRCSRHTQLANLPVVLLRYHFHADNTSNRHRDEQIQTADRIRCSYLSNLGIVPTPNECQLHTDLIQFRLPQGKNHLDAAGAWLLRLNEAARKTLGISEAVIINELSRYWYGACASQAEQGLATWTTFMSIPLGRRGKIAWQAKLLARCLTRQPV